jgi:hypothetical protein
MTRRAFQTIEIPIYLKKPFLQKSHEVKDCHDIK